MIKEILLVLGILIALVCLRILFKIKKRRDEYIIFKKENCNNGACGSCWFGQNIRTGEKTECFRDKEKLGRYIDGK